MLYAHNTHYTHNKKSDGWWNWNAATLKCNFNLRMKTFSLLFLCVFQRTWIFLILRSKFNDFLIAFCTTWLNFEFANCLSIFLNSFFMLCEFWKFCPHRNKLSEIERRRDSHMLYTNIIYMCQFWKVHFFWLERKSTFFPVFSQGLHFYLQYTKDKWKFYFIFSFFFSFTWPAFPPSITLHSLTAKFNVFTIEYRNQIISCVKIIVVAKLQDFVRSSWISYDVVEFFFIQNWPYSCVHLFKLVCIVCAPNIWTKEMSQW